MTMHTSQIGGTESTHIPLGAKLQNAREAQRIDRKDAAAQLRLNESVIDMIENNSFPDTMPQIFIRGYIRAYGKLLQISEDTIQAGLEPVKPRVITQEAKLAMPVTQTEPRLNRSSYAMKGVTTAVAITLVWLMAAWWNSRATAPMTDNAITSLPTETAALNTTITPAAPAENAPSAPVIAPATSSSTTALTENYVTKPVANQLPAGISIAQPVAPHTAQNAPAYTPNAGAISAPPAAIAAPKVAVAPKIATASAAPIAPKATAAPSPIPAYKRAAMASDASHKIETSHDISEE